MAKCYICGKKALEVVEICQECLQRAEVHREKIKRLRQISNILGLTANTDTNIKNCMESLLEIAEELERDTGNGKEKKKEEGTAISKERGNYL